MRYDVYDIRMIVNQLKASRSVCIGKEWILPSPTNISRLESLGQVIAGDDGTVTEKQLLHHVEHKQGVEL